MLNLGRTEYRGGGNWVNGLLSEPTIQGHSYTPLLLFEKLYYDDFSSYSTKNRARMG